MTTAKASGTKAGRRAKHWSPAQLADNKQKFAKLRGKLLKTCCSSACADAQVGTAVVLDERGDEVSVYVFRPGLYPPPVDAPTSRPRTRGDAILRDRDWVPVALAANRVVLVERIEVRVSAPVRARTVLAVADDERDRPVLLLLRIVGPSDGDGRRGMVRCRCCNVPTPRSAIDLARRVCLDCHCSGRAIDESADAAHDDGRRHDAARLYRAARAQVRQQQAYGASPWRNAMEHVRRYKLKIVEASLYEGPRRGKKKSKGGD